MTHQSPPWLVWSSTKPPNSRSKLRTVRNIQWSTQKYYPRRLRKTETTRIDQWLPLASRRAASTRATLQRDTKYCRRTRRSLGTAFLPFQEADKGLTTRKTNLIPSKCSPLFSKIPGYLSREGRVKYLKMRNNSVSGSYPHLTITKQVKHNWSRPMNPERCSDCNPRMINIKSLLIRKYNHRGGAMPETRHQDLTLWRWVQPMNR